VSAAGGSRKIVLRHEDDGAGLRHLEARRTSNGGVVIEGQDLGGGVGQAFGGGFSEYEWAWTIASGDVPAAVAALGGPVGTDPVQVLPLLKRWMAGNGGRDPGTHLQESGVPIAFWSRVGE
jgi:hypothetical protein